MQWSRVGPSNTKWVFAAVPPMSSTTTAPPVFCLVKRIKGLAAMFTMMNYERLSVGLQGLGSGELAYQQSAAYARDRLQGRAPTGPKNPDGPADSLLVHPDVRRMLLTQRAFNEGGRAFAMLVGMQLDLAKYMEDKEAQALSELLTPIAKAFLSDRGFDGAVMGQQVFGGHGYISEWGAEQIVRDARIAQIYEGTNGVQAYDLIARKVLKDGGVTLHKFVDHMRDSTVAPQFQSALHEALDRLVRVVSTVIAKAQADVNHPGAVSTEFLDLTGLTIYAWLWARMAHLAPDNEFGAAKRATAEFFYERLLPRTVGLEASIGADATTLMAFTDF